MAVATGSILPGDIVEVDKKGRRFYAEVTGSPERNGGRSVIVPIDPTPINNGKAISYRTATGREIVAHYRRLGRSRG